MLSTTSGYRYDIDGLRAVAVASVVLGHAGLGFTGGFVGVDVFFVISGYLITGLIRKDLSRGSFSLLEFWERRLRRILPALFVVVAATVATGWCLMAPADYEELGRSVVGLVLLVSNVQFWRESGYFQAAAEEKPLLHTWSLAVEEQFYLVLPPLMILLTRWLGPRRVVWALLGLLLLSFGSSVYGVQRAPSATFYLLPTRAWELLAGSVLSCVAWSRSPIPGRWRGTASALGLSLITVPCLYYTAATPFPGLAALPVVAGSVLLIGSGGEPGAVPLINRLLGGRLAVFVGQISYSLYLWHWPLLAYARYTSLGPLSAGTRIGVVTASVALAVASWRYVEQPFRARRWLASRSGLWRSAVLSYVLMLAAGLGLVQWRGLDWRLPRQARLFASTGRKDPRYFGNVEISDLPDRVPVYGRRSSDTELLVWGDSHAMCLLPALDEVARQQAVTIRAAVHHSAAPVLDYYSRRFGVIREQAVPHNRAVMEYAKSGRFRAVLLAANWAEYAYDDGFRDGLLKTVDELQKSGSKVYFVLDVPGFSMPVPKGLIILTCSGQPLDRLATDRPTYNARNRFHDSLIPLLQSRGVAILDPWSYLLPSDGSARVQPYDEQGSFYFDDDHLSVHGAMRLRPLFEPILVRMRGERQPADSPGAGAGSAASSPDNP